MHIFRIAAWLLFLLAGTYVACADELLCSFSDPAGDRDVIHDLSAVTIDVVRIDFAFDSTTGDFTTTAVAAPAKPFSGHINIIVHLYNPDAGVTVNPGFTSSVSGHMRLDAPKETISWTGTNSWLTKWKAGQRVAIGTDGLGNPSDAAFSLFGSAADQLTDDGQDTSSIDYIGQAGGMNGRSTVVATIVRNPSPPHRQPKPRLSPQARPPLAARPTPPFRVQQPRGGPMNGIPAIPNRPAKRASSLSDELEDVLTIGIPVVAAIGALIFFVRTIQSARRAPLRERTLAFGLLSMSLSLLALGCSAIPFVPPGICAVPALGVSAIGVALAFIGVRQSEQVSTVGACYAGLVANAGVTLLALALFMPKATHVIDRVEHSPLVMLLIQSSVLSSVLAIIALRIWLWLSQRGDAEQRFHFGLSSLLLTCGAIPIWLWLSLALPIPDMLWGGGFKPKSLHAYIDVISDLMNLGALSTFLKLMTPFALYVVTVAVHPLVSRYRSAWPLSAFLAGLVVTITLYVSGLGVRTGWTNGAVVGPPVAPGVEHSVPDLSKNADIPNRSIHKLASDAGGVPTLADGDHFGSSVASLGDLDGDGVTDLAVGASGTDTGGTDCGAMYVLQMNANGTVKFSQQIASGIGGGPDLANRNWFGVSVASLGDVDGDGITDLAVGAGGTGNDKGNYQVGAVHVLFLNSNGTAKGSQKITCAAAGGPPGANQEWFGRSVASLGDLNSDGVPDLAVGADGDNTGGFRSGAVYILFMDSDGTVKKSEKIASNVGGGPPLANDEFFGWSLASLGDLDGDGVTDLAVGADGNNTGGFRCGAVYILFMNTNGTVRRSQKIANSVGGGPRLAVSDLFGCSLASLPDLDGDGVIDLAVGATNPDTGGRNQSVHILLMNANGTAKRSRKITSGAGGGPILAGKDVFGFSLASLGDLDGNGFPDLAVGAIRDGSGEIRRGAVYIVALEEVDLGQSYPRGDEGRRAARELAQSDRQLKQRLYSQGRSSSSKTIMRQIPFEEQQAIVAAGRNASPLRNGDFSAGLDGWNIEGGASSFHSFRDETGWWLTTFGDHKDGDTGRLYQCFKVPDDAAELRFKLGGGANVEKTYVALWRKDRLYRKLSARNSNTDLVEGRWDLTSLRGEVVTLEVVDRSTTRWGFIGLQDFRIIKEKDTQPTAEPTVLPSGARSHLQTGRNADPYQQLRESTTRATQLIYERHLNLVKRQEWTPPIVICNVNSRLHTSDQAAT